MLEYLFLIPSLFAPASQQKGVKSNPNYPEVGDLVYSNDYVAHQSKLEGNFDVVVNKGELIGQIVQMNVTDSKEEYTYYMKVQRPDNSIVYVAIMNPYDESLYVFDNEWYKVVVNPNYSYPVSNSKQPTTTQSGGINTPDDPTIETPQKQPSPPPIDDFVIDEAPPKPNYLLIGGIAVGGLTFLALLIWGVSSPQSNEKQSSKFSKSKR
ncbi:hypothetical protein [Runella limosa]|uniref:hypothetical protein n=1 Tax=Runella limosa TaxID=370978 RepID=UPI00040198A5|nr:hypothetical protein [Runella limosa]